MAEIGNKELRTDWPNIQGLTLGTTKIDGVVSNLIPEISLVNMRDKVGLN